MAESLTGFLGPTRLVTNLAPPDFEQLRLHISQHGLTRKSNSLGPHALTRAITVVRSIFRYAYDNELIEKPVRFGAGFDKPSATLKRRIRRASEMENGKRLFEPAEIHALIKAAASLESYGGPDADAEALRKAFQEGSIVHLYADQAR